MTARARNRERLAEVLTDAVTPRLPEYTGHSNLAELQADALLASDALAQMLAEARAEALREFAGKWADWIAKGAPQARGGAAYRAICEAQLLEAALAER